MFENLFGIDCHFNEYYRNFVVVTKTEMRTYDGLTGKLVKVFSDVVDKRTNAEISAFCLDNRHRKCYLGDTVGTVRVFNVSNGVFIKNVNHDDDNELRLKRNLWIKQDKAKEISQLEFVNFDDLLMLLTTSWDSKLRVYDEEDPDETQMLRKSKGGHFNDDISALAFDAHLSLVATGSRSGVVCVWDFETNKLEGVCLGHKRAVAALAFAGAFPLLVGAGQCGLVCLWGVRPSPYEARHVCLGRFLNLGWDGEFFTNIGVTCAFVKVVQRDEDEGKSEKQSAYDDRFFERIDEMEFDASRNE